MRKYVYANRYQSEGKIGANRPERQLIDGAQDLVNGEQCQRREANRYQANRYKLRGVKGRGIYWGIPGRVQDTGGVKTRGQKLGVWGNRVKRGYLGSPGKAGSSFWKGPLAGESRKPIFTRIRPFPAQEVTCT